MKRFCCLLILSAFAIIPIAAMCEEEYSAQKVQSKDGKAPEKEGDYYRFFGDKISLRANDKFIYIKAGETTIVADAQGQVQIKAAGDLTLASPGSVNISAGKDINFKANGRVVTESGGAKEVSLP